MLKGILSEKNEEKKNNVNDCVSSQGLVKPNGCFVGYCEIFVVWEKWKF